MRILVFDKTNMRVRKRLLALGLPAIDEDLLVLPVSRTKATLRHLGKVKRRFNLTNEDIIVREGAVLLEQQPNESFTRFEISREQDGFFEIEHREPELTDL
jgi:hypothetical protein